MFRAHASSALPPAVKLFAGPAGICYTVLLGRRPQALPHASPALTRVTPRLQAREALGVSLRKALRP